LYFLDHFGIQPDDPRVNQWGGAIAYGHPLAASGPRLVAFLGGLFQENPAARYGLTTMCVGRGQGYSMIWQRYD
jgi:acetyl-CoA acyltransferase